MKINKPTLEQGRGIPLGLPYLRMVSMLNYRTCNDIKFRFAMDTLHQLKSGSVDITTVSDEILHIMYTKMHGDLHQLSGVNGSYATGLRISTQKNLELLHAELVHRDWLSIDTVE